MASNQPYLSIGPRWTPRDGWVIAISAMGTAIAKAPLLAVASSVATVASGAVVIAGSIVLIGGSISLSIALYRWATSDEPSRIPRVEIERRRAELSFESESNHVAICGPAGSGKTSVINALRGLQNNHHDAAAVGNNETTVERGKYAAHSNLGSLFLYDFPGAGTLRVPASDYYYNQEFCLYDRLLIVQGERFGEVEIALARACIRHGQAFTFIRSRADEIIRRIMEDGDVGDAFAKQQHKQSTAEAVGTELRRAACPEEQIIELLGFCVLVNKQDLQVIASLAEEDWPLMQRKNEIDERNLVRFLKTLETAVDE